MRQSLIDHLDKSAAVHLMGATPLLTSRLAVDALVEWLRQQDEWRAGYLIGEALADLLEEGGPCDT